jgi:hypothetical protein
MTPEQQKDAVRLERYIEREQLCAVMNNTKWRELKRVLLEIPGYSVRFRVKCLRQAAGSWDGDFLYHLPTYRVIEWLDISPIVDCHYLMRPEHAVADFTEQVEAALQSVHIPYTWHDQVIRIYGYLRSAK